MDDLGVCKKCGSKERPLDRDFSNVMQFHLVGLCPICGNLRWETVVNKRFLGTLKERDERMEKKDA
jgi:hypothetical protein